MSKSVKRVGQALSDAGIDVRIHEMPDSTRTAAEAAAAVGCGVDQIAKSIIFRGETSGHVVLFLTAGSRQVDPIKASDVAGQPLGRADAGFVRRETGFAIGGVAPVGHLTSPAAFWDPRLSDFDEIWAAAGTPRHVFAIQPAELLRISGAQPADFTS